MNKIPSSTFTFSVDTRVGQDSARTDWDSKARAEGEAHRLRMLAAEDDAKTQRARADGLEARLRTKVGQLLSFQRRCTCPVVTMAELDTNEVDDLYARINALEAESDAKSAQLRAFDADRKQLRDRLETRDIEISQKDLQVGRLQDEVKQLKLQNEEKDADIVQQKAIANDIQENLDKYKADVDDLQQQRLDAVKEKHDWQIRYTECDDKLQSLREEWEDDQDKIAELEAANEEAKAMTTEISELEVLINNLNEEIGEVQRANQVKDQRVAKLERELQKSMDQEAQLKKHNEELQQQRAEAADAGAMTPPPITEPSTGDSLEEEMEALGEDLEPEEEHEELTFSAITTVHEQTPISLKITVSEITSVETDPIIPKLTISGISSVETEPLSPKLSVSSISTVDTKPVAPTLSLSGISSVATRPLSPELSVSSISFVETQPNAPNLSLSGISSMATEPIEPQPPASTTSIGTQTSVIEPNDAPMHLHHALPTGFFGDSNSDMELRSGPTDDDVISLDSSVGTQTPALCLDFSGITFIDTEPVVAAPVTPTPIDLSISDVSAIETEPVRAAVTSTEDVTTTRPKRQFFDFSSLLSLFWLLLLGLFLSRLWTALQDFAPENRLVSDYCFSEPGAYGRPGHVLRVLPNAFDLGATGLRENVSRLTTKVVRHLGGWAGADRASLM